jgi:hypothetical protein
MPRGDGTRRRGGGSRPFFLLLLLLVGLPHLSHAALV